MSAFLLGMGFRGASRKADSVSPLGGGFEPTGASDGPRTATISHFLRVTRCHPKARMGGAE